MCGIVAVLKPGGVSAPLLTQMRDALVHRGPDAGEQWIEGDIGLAHRRLSVLDTSSASNQPMISDDGRLVLIFNGEIYNYIELRQELRSAGRVFRTEGDTEVLLQALDHWGRDAIPRLNGMFAFALWDRRERRLLLARDRFGEKPLFLTAFAGGGLGLASEMKALLRHPDVSTEMDPDTLGSYARSAYYEEGPNTFFKAIKRMPAAHAAIYDDKGVMRETWRYWTPDYDHVDDRIDQREALERFRELLERSVKMRLRSDVKVGSSLSGGLDSSIVVGMLAKEREAGIAFEQDTFSARFPEDLTMCEGEFIDAVVGYTGVKSHNVTPNPYGLMEECRKLHWHQEEPFLSASIYLQYCVARLAKQNGTVVQLDGQGADELLGGYQYYYRQHQLDLADQGEWGQLEEATRSFNDRLERAAANYTDSGRRFSVTSAYSMDEIAAMRSQNEPQPMYQGGPWSAGLPTVGPGRRVRRMLAEAMQYNSLPQLLRYADRNAMAFSREGRLPYLDYDLVDYTISLPDRVLFSDGWQKYALRRAGEGLIPDNVRWRADKVGYAAPLDLWIRGPLKDWCYERVFQGPVVDLPGYDRQALRGFWDQHQAGANTSWALWRWISLNEWLELDRTGAWRSDVAASRPLEVRTTRPDASAVDPAAVDAVGSEPVETFTPPKAKGLVSRIAQRLFGL